MIQDFRASIMAPIGEPINITGFNPIFNRPEPFVRPLPPMQPPQLPPVTPPPILPPVTPPVIPPQPPSIGGIGGINQDLRPLERPIIPPKRNDFISINRVNSDDLRQRQALGLTGVPGVGSNNFGGTPLGQQPIVMDSGPQTTGIRALKDTRDYANMTDDEIRKIMGPNPTVPGRSPKPISQEQIDEFRFDKLNPGMLFEMIQNRDISPDDYDDPLAKKIATRLQESERKRREFFENNPVTPPVAPPPPDGTPLEPLPIKGGPRPIPIQPIPRPIQPIDIPAPILPDPRDSIGTIEPVPMPTIEPVPTPTVEPEPTPTEPLQPINVSNQDPFAASVTQQQVGLDPLTEQLLFGIGGQGGFIPGAMRAAEKVFYDEQGNPVVIDEQVAGFSPDQLQAMQMQREALGIQNPFLQGAGQAFGAGTQALEEGLQRGRTAAIGALEATRGGVGSLQTGLGESADILRGTLGGYDPSMTQQFYDPFEDKVVQQTIEDIMEQGAKSDIGARASDIARGGESAFGSRARLGASERQEALGRGLAEALSGIRSRGFQQAQQTGLGEFARQKAAERAASSGLASLAGQGFGGSQALAGALSGLGQTEQDIGQQRFSGQFGLGTSLQGLGAQAAGASASDIAALYGMGSQQQQQTQQMLDAQRRNLQQRQMTPLLQYQALAPFVGMAPAGQFQTTTQFAPPPSPMQAGLGVGLSAFGALGQLYGGGK
jgi:hypothetical protein